MTNGIGDLPARGANAPDAEASRTPSASVAAWWTVVVLMILQTVSLMDRNILSLVVIEIRADLGLTDFQISLLQGLAFIVPYLIGGLVIGGLVDRFRAKPILFLAVTIWSLACAAGGLARSFWGLMFSRMGTGIGEGAVSPTGQVLILSSFPKERVSLPMAAFVGSGAIGLGISYLSGGLLLEAINAKSLPGLESLAPWRQVLIVTALPALLIGLLAFTVQDRRDPWKRTDAGDRAGREFLRHLVRQRKLVGRVVLGYGLLAMITYGIYAWAPTYGRRVLDLSPGEVGLRMGLLLPVFGVFGSFAYGYLVDRQVSRGKTDYALWSAAWGLLIVVPVALVGYTANHDGWFLASLIAMQIVTASVFGPGMAAIHMITPAGMRGRMAALLVTGIMLVGYSGGPLLIGAYTDYLFRDPQKVGLSIALMVATVAPAAAWLILSIRSTFMARVAEFESSQSAPDSAMS